MSILSRIWVPTFLMLGASIPLTLAQTAGVVLPQRGLCAHRGCLDTHPENTLPAFRQAISLGAQMIEFDVQLTKDSVLVIVHDETVDRTTNGTGKVSDLTFSGLRRLDAGAKKHRSLPERSCRRSRKPSPSCPETYG